MKLVALASALALLSGAPGTADPGGDLMERLSIDQLMRLSTMPPARIVEMRCAGFGQWLVANRPADPQSPNRATADRLSAEVQAAIANDAELPADLARDVL